MWSNVETTSDAGASGLWHIPSMVLVSMLVVWLIGRRIKQRRSLRLRRSLADSTLGKLHYARGPNVSGFAATFTPAPHPFCYLEVIYVAHCYADPIDLLMSLFGRSRNALVLRGKLAPPLQAELMWQRGQHPGIVLGRHPGANLWTFADHDFTGVRFATRGANTKALSYTFTEMVNRFGVAAQSLRVLQDTEYHAVAVVHVAHMHDDSFPSLIASLCALCKTAARHSV